MDQILLVTQNKHKIEEIKSKFPAHIRLECLSDIGWTAEIIETGNTLEENAMLKARTVFDKINKPCFAEDSGLEVDALNGAPGVFTARYAGDEKDPIKNMIKLLRDLENSSTRSAQFRTVIAYKDMDKEILFEGIVRGKMAIKIRGENGFGYDPIFIPEGYDKTFAELPNEIKLRISHRTRALEKLCEALMF